MRADAPAAWLSVAEARSAILADVRPLPAERRALLHALGHVLAEELRAPLDLPTCDNSAMDGFAVRGADVRGASAERPVRLPVVGEVRAGALPERAVGAGEAVRITTGSPLPEGADCVVRIEHTAPDGADAVLVLRDDDAGHNVRRRGEDVRAGDLVLPVGTVLGAGPLAVAASLGRAQLSVVRRPVVGVLASGDELVEVDGFAEVAAGRRIVSSNSYALAAQLAEIGCEARLLGIAHDTPQSLRTHLEAAAGCDALVTAAGMALGEHDLMRAVLGELGLELGFWRVRMRPGSPFGYGRVAALGGIPWFGLPGNPVSAMVTFEVLARPALLRLAGHAAVFRPTLRVRLLDDYRAAPGLTHFARARLSRGPDGEPRAALTGPQGSGVLTSMAHADALLVIPPERAGAAAGERLTALRLTAGLQAEAEYDAAADLAADA